MFGIDFAGHGELRAAAAAAGVRGPPAAQGVRARLPGGEAVAGREGAGRVRGRRRRRPIRPPGVPAPGEWGPTPTPAGAGGVGEGPRGGTPGQTGPASVRRGPPGRPSGDVRPGLPRGRRPVPPTAGRRGPPRRPHGAPATGARRRPAASAAGAAAGPHGRSDRRRGYGLMPLWLELVLRVGGVVVAFLTLPLIVGQAEHKVMAHMQGRLGPMYAGAFHGWAQLVADGVKFVQKEDITPREADRAVFRLAPVVALVPYLLVLLVIPLGPSDLVGQPLDIGLFFVLAVVGVGVVAVLMSAWASANKYSLLGGLRGGGPAARLRAAAGAGRAPAWRWRPARCSLSGIVEAWRPWWLLWQAPAMVDLLRRRAGRDPPAAVRHADRRLRAGLRLHDRVHRAAVRVLPARRVRRHRGDRRADHRAVPRRLAGPVRRRPARLAVDAAQGVRGRRS